jgi:hypothetical protein
MMMMPPSSATLWNVSGAVMVDMMSAPTNSSSPSRMPPPKVRTARLIGGLPTVTTKARNYEKHRGQHDTGNYDPDARKLEKLGELIYEDVGHIGIHRVLPCHFQRLLCSPHLLRISVRYRLCHNATKCVRLLQP